MKCPKCGKPMVEEGEWAGLWICPDYKEPLNDTPPFRWKCNGMNLTKEGGDAFEKELIRQHLERN